MNGKIIDNTGLFDRPDDDKNDTMQPDQHQDDSNPPNDGPVDVVTQLYAITLVQNSDGTPEVTVDGTPSLIEMQMLLYRALCGVQSRIQAETTSVMLANLLGMNQPGPIIGRQ